MIIKKDLDSLVKDLGRLVAEKLPSDPDVKLPADVQATIARGEEAFKNQSRSVSTRVRDDSDLIPRIITSVIDQSIQDRRDAILTPERYKRRGTVDNHR